MPMAIPLVAAYASISAGIAATGFIGGLMIAGGAMTALGAVTHDKTLSRWGGVLSLAGGAAGLASGAWEGAAQNIASESTAGDYVNQMDLASDAASAGAGGAVEAGTGAALDAGGAVAMPVSPSADPSALTSFDPLDPMVGQPVAVAQPAQQVPYTTPGTAPAGTQAGGPAPTAAPPVSGPAATSQAQPTPSA